MNNKKTLCFLALTFLWSWSLWIIGLDIIAGGMTQETFGKFLICFFTGVYGPSVSAIATTLYFDGLSATAQLLKKIFVWKVSPANYLWLAVLPIVFVLIAIGLYGYFVGEVGTFEKTAFYSIPTILLAGLYAGPLGEELGWRGFLLPELQKQFSPLKSALIIGSIWFSWHIPLFRAPFGTLVSGGPLSTVPVITYLVMILCLSVIVTWLVNNSKGSVLIAILFHLSVNAGIALLFFPKLAADFKTVHLLSGAPMLIFTIYLIASDKLKTIKPNLNPTENHGKTRPEQIVQDLL